MVGHLHKAGMVVIPDAEKADVVIVNTCSFIDSSKEESIGHILEVHTQRGLRKKRRDQKLIVAGCMSQRFSKDLPGSMLRGRCIHRAGPDHAGRPDHRGNLCQGARIKGPACELCHPAVNVHTRLRHSQVQADAAAFRIRQDCGGLQPSVHFLHHPADQGQAPQQDCRQRRCGGPAARGRGCEGSEPHLAGHHLLRNGYLGGAAQPPHARRFQAGDGAHFLLRGAERHRG